ncbi:MAG: 2-C-methyl-D-erythritol 4-phosphate cytidylyltransferase [Nitrospirota bacterium]
MKVTALIPSAGIGKRMGTERPKQFLTINGLPMLVYTLKVFDVLPEVDEIILIVHKGDEGYCEKIIEGCKLKKVLKIVFGGKTRQESVYNGLKEVSDETGIVVIHDAVRPFVTPEIIRKSIKTARYSDGAVAAIPVRDTMKYAGDKGIIERTVSRSNLWLAQTPQTFRLEIIKEAYHRAYLDNFSATDDSSLVERIGYKVKVIEGSYSNIKITTPEDIILAQRMLDKVSPVLAL